MPVYTVGNEKNYDYGIKKYGDEFKKLGKTPGCDITGGLPYAGGFACQTPEDARRLLEEQGRVGEWAVYELAADWEKDTVPSKNGWWHALIRDAVIVKKVV